MEIDVELVGTLNQAAIAAVEKALPQGYEFVRFEQDRFSVRLRSEVVPSESVDSAVFGFLAGINEPNYSLLRSSGRLRVGVYISEDEASAFIAEISADTTEVLAELRLGFEVSFYPCSPDADDRGPAEGLMRPLADV